MNPPGSPTTWRLRIIPLSGDPASGISRRCADDGGPAATASPCPRPRKSSSLRKERDEFREQALRARAEFANYQKRAKQQADTDRAYAVGSLARDLLDSLDNLAGHRRPARLRRRRASPPGSTWSRNNYIEVLAKHGVEPIAALGEPFDPNFHDAVLQQPSREHPEGTVVGELSKGYKIRDRVLRPTKVAVSVRPPHD